MEEEIEKDEQEDSGKLERGGTAAATDKNKDRPLKETIAMVEIVDGPLEIIGIEREMRGTPLVIGRSPQADITVLDPKVSRNHAVIELRNNSYYVTDLDSTNGTILNNTALISNEPAILKHNDEIQVSDTILKFYLFKNLEADEMSIVKGRITEAMLEKYSSSTTVVFAGIHKFRDLYLKHPTTDVDNMRERFLFIIRYMMGTGRCYFFLSYGDRVCFCFDNPQDALIFAVNLRDEVERFSLKLLRDPNEEIRKIDVQIGIHTGEVELKTNKDGAIEETYGETVKVAEALCNKADAGDLLIPGALYDTLTPKGKESWVELEMVELGTDLPDIRVFQFYSEATAYL